MNTKRCVLIALAGLALSINLGCNSQPQVARDNRRLIESILTAVSAKNPEWLAANVKIVEDKKSQGAMDPAEYQTFREILDLAQAGKWEDATSRVYALRDAQRPTSDDLRRLDVREVEHGKAPRIKVRTRAGL